jgi:hypothetical protein
MSRSAAWAFAVEERTRVRERVITLATAYRHISGGAVTAAAERLGRLVAEVSGRP